MLLNLVTPLHESTKRDYMARLMDDKVACMKVARQFERDYWDGERRYGYGGYTYDGRWESVARGLIERYDLIPGDLVMDVGCGKGFLLYELQKLMPRLALYGIDRSRYAIENKHPKLKASLKCEKVERAFLGGFNLVISLGTLHNLTLHKLHKALRKFSEAKNAYIMVESFRNEQEWFNLCAWCLTAETIMRPEDWCFLFDQCGYKGDYEFIFFR
jgi:SAM-dependent methyltransferase